MSELNSLLTSLGLSPDNENSQFLTTSSFRRYNSNIKTSKQQPLTASVPGPSIPLNVHPNQDPLPTTPIINKRKRKSEQPTKRSTKKQIIAEPEPPPPEPSEPAEIRPPKISNRKVARYCPRQTHIAFQLKCEWNDCETVCSNMDDFLDHIDSHLQEADLLADLVNPSYLCDWAECDCISFECVDTFKRHVRFHAFHTKLKEIGENVLSTMELNSNISDTNQPVPSATSKS
jgi:hypothetical protein